MSVHLTLDGNKHYKSLDSLVWIELNDTFLNLKSLTISLEH